MIYRVVIKSSNNHPMILAVNSQSLWYVLGINNFGCLFFQVLPKKLQFSHTFLGFRECIKITTNVSLDFIDELFKMLTLLINVKSFFQIFAACSEYLKFNFKN